MATLEKHRVRLFLHDEKTRLDGDDLFWKVADLFQQTDKYQWAVGSGIKLNYEVHNDSKWHMGSQVLIYADLDDAEYGDYILNFYEFEKEDWK